MVVEHAAWWRYISSCFYVYSIFYYTFNGKEGEEGAAFDSSHVQKVSGENNWSEVKML